MKKIILILFALLYSYSINAQKLKEYLPSIVCTFLSGTTDGLRDASLFRMDGYGRFWNGKISWLNKYKNHDIKQGPAYFGSTTFLVWTTDCPHLANLATHQFSGLAAALAPYDDNKRFFHVFLKVAVYNIIRETGQYLVYSVIFKPQGRD